MPIEILKELAVKHLKDGYYKMNDNFLEDFVLEIITDKKYLNKKQLDILNKDLILFDMAEPF